MGGLPNGQETRPYLINNREVTWMAAESQMEQLIVENVMKELAKRGLMGNGSPNQVEMPEKGTGSQSRTESYQENGEGALTIPDITGIWVPNPENIEAIKVMKQATPARIGLYRAGARPKTGAMLKFMADHAQAMDAVFLNVSEEFLQRMNLFSVDTLAQDKEEFLKRPELGRKLSPEGEKTIKEKCEKNPQVQIIAVDGLSSSSIEANVPDVLPALTQGLTAAGIKVGTPFFIRNGRVGVQDHVGRVLNAEVVVSLIGERPGLVTADSMSAYIIYSPNEKTVEADRTVFSNIHRGGTPPAEAGAHLVDVIKRILKAKASGMKLNQ